MVIKSDQTVVGNFHLYTNNLDIQTVGISNIAQTTAISCVQRLNKNHAPAERNIFPLVQRCLEGLRYYGF